MVELGDSPRPPYTMAPPGLAYEIPAPPPLQFKIRSAVPGEEKVSLEGFSVYPLSYWGSSCKSVAHLQFFSSLLSQRNNVVLMHYFTVQQCMSPGAYELEHATPLHSCHGVFIDRFIFRSNLL